MMQLRAAEIADLPVLTALCLRSKAVWGYDATFMAACVDELTLRPDDLSQSSVQMAIDGAEIVGVVQVEFRIPEAEITKLFVEPQAMGRGIGRRLFDWAAHEASARAMEWLTIVADPNAAAFYRKMGAEPDGMAPSGSIPGRSLPRFRYRLSQSPARTGDRESP